MLYRFYYSSLLYIYTSFKETDSCVYLKKPNSLIPVQTLNFFNSQFFENTKYFNTRTHGERGGLKETDSGVYPKWSNSHSFFDVGTHSFFLWKILSILTHTHGKMGESFKEIDKRTLI